MEVLYTDLSLDFADNRTLKTIKIKQHDDRNRIIRIAFFHKGQRITLDSNTDTAVINASVGGTVTAYHDDTGVGINNISNTVNVTLTDNLTTLAGTEHCEIMVSYTDSRINANRISHTATFDLLVEPSVANTDHQSILANTDLALNWAAELADINADIISLQSQLFELEKKISSSIISAVSGLHPEYEQEILTVHVSESATLIGQHYYDISTDIFDYKRDGLLILRDAFLIEKPLYYFEEQTNAVRVNFNVPSFFGTETLYFYIYRKPYDTPSTIGTAIRLIDGNDTGVNTGAAIPEIHW